MMSYVDDVDDAVDVFEFLFLYGVGNCRILR
jgi:hypothetical protein